MSTDRMPRAQSGDMADALMRWDEIDYRMQLGKPVRFEDRLFHERLLRNNFSEVPFEPQSRNQNGGQ